MPKNNNLLIKRARDEKDEMENLPFSKQLKNNELNTQQRIFFKFESLPNELKLNIIKFLDLVSLSYLSQTNHSNLKLITEGEINQSALAIDIPLFGEPLIWTQIKEKYIAPSLFYGKAQMQWYEVQQAKANKIVSPLENPLNQPAKTFKEFYEIEEILDEVNINIIIKALRNHLRYNEKENTLDLSCCSLTRLPLKKILEESQLYNKLISLKKLNLSSNLLSGAIPVELTLLSNLEDLNLFNNELSGMIPPELSQLKNLKKLSLSLNELDGPIPEELAQRFSDIINLEGGVAHQSIISKVRAKQKRSVKIKYR